MEKYKVARLYDAGGDLLHQWYVFYSYRNPETGQYQRFRKTISQRLLTKTARYAAGASIIKDLNKWLRSGGNPFNEYGRMSIIQAIDLFVKSKSVAHRLRTYYTYRNYASCLKKYIQDNKLDNICPNEFTHEICMKFFDWLQITQLISNRTYNNYRTAIKTLFSFLLERKIIETNPVTGIKKLELEESAITRFTMDELKLIKDELPKHNYALYSIANLVFYAFIRPQEIVRLRPESFDLVNQKIYIDGKASKNKKTQVVVIPDPLVEILVELKNLRSDNDNYIFSSGLRPGKIQIAPTRIAEHWKKWAASVGITKGIYMMKHTGAGMAIQAGMNVRDLQLQLRHSSLNETQKYLEKFNNIASDRLKKGFPRY